MRRRAWLRVYLCKIGRRRAILALSERLFTNSIFAMSRVKNGALEKRKKKKRKRKVTSLDPPAPKGGDEDERRNPGQTSFAQICTRVVKIKQIFCKIFKVIFFFRPPPPPQQTPSNLQRAAAKFPRRSSRAGPGQIMRKIKGV